MGFIEDSGISEECFTAGFSTEIDSPAAVFEVRKICRIGIPEFSSAEADEVRALLIFG